MQSSMNIIQLNRIRLNNVSLNALGTSEGKAGVKVVWEERTFEGADILTIKDAKANGVTSLLVSGNCYQNGTPTPSAPKDIVTNKGALRYVIGKNLLEVRDDNIVVGKYINNAGVPTESLPNIYFQRFISVKPSTTYTLSTSEGLNYANFMEYDSSGVFIKRTLYGASTSPVGTSVSHTMGDTTAFVIIGSNVNSSKYPSITKDDVKGIKWMLNEGSSALKYEAYNGKVVAEGKDEILAYGKNLSVGELIGKGYASTGAVSISTTFCGNLHKIPVAAGQQYTVSWGNLPDGVSGVFINTWKTDGSWNARQAISATDHLTYTIPSGVGEVNFTLYKTGGITIGADTWMQVEYGDTATEYQPAIVPSSASIELLLGYGGYHDYEQCDIVNGVITRKFGIKIFDGSEAYTEVNSGYTVGGVIADDVDTNRDQMCSHFKNQPGSKLADGYFNVYKSDGELTVSFGSALPLEDFRKYLQMEYAKGTPVILVYRLASEKIEGATPRFFPNPKGDVTIIRNAELSNLPMEVVINVKKPEEGLPITFYIDGQPFNAKSGMTWAEWCDSEFNTEGYYIGDFGTVEYSTGGDWLSEIFAVADASGIHARGEDEIRGDAIYTLRSMGIG